MSTTSRLPTFVPLVLLVPMVMWPPSVLALRVFMVALAIVAAWQPWLRRRPLERA
jgi:hypothetical protein